LISIGEGRRVRVDYASASRVFHHYYLLEAKTLQHTPDLDNTRRQYTLLARSENVDGSCAMVRYQAIPAASLKASFTALRLSRNWTQVFPVVEIYKPIAIFPVL
jgi:hypothetical protein